jgi:hypothetical protein
MNSIAALGRLTGRFLPREALDAARRRSMYVLLRSHFVGVDAGTFERDLLQKNWVILLEDHRGALRGFSTLLVYPEQVAGSAITVVYSGDTIVAREWWGSAALPLTWLRAVRQIAPLYGRPEVYWLLLTSGFRTYRFLPVFFKDFLPRWDRAQSPDGALLAMLAGAQFGDRFDPGDGVVRFVRPQVLAPELLDVPHGRAADPHVAFFLARNPGYVRGDELVCLARIADENLTAAGQRIARSLDSSCGGAGGP